MAATGWRAGPPASRRALRVQDPGISQEVCFVSRKLGRTKAEIRDNSAAVLSCISGPMRARPKDLTITDAAG